jgi:V/A-type H+-transporting ATPase subunit I
MERLGQLLFLGGIILLVAATVTRSAVVLSTAALFAAIGIVTLVRGAGIIGLLEVFSLISNILSYARLMALGMASVVLALVANRMFSQFDSGFIGLLVAIPLHALNIVIGMFSPTIHTLRLHYVEFFSKFYKPGGRNYVRFGAEMRKS